MRDENTFFFGVLTLREISGVSSLEKVRTLTDLPYHTE